MKLLSFLLTASFLLPSAHATVEDPAWELENARQPKARRPVRLPPAEMYARTRAVLEHFGAEEEDRDPREFEVYQRRTSLEGMRRVLAMLDRANQFPRFNRMDERGLEAFADRDGYSVREADLDLSADSGYVSPALNNLMRARRNSARAPLAGLKIAIDPGHMSTPEWDRMAGKFVRDRQGRTLSEGLLNLQTAFLLKQEFERLGARVHLTRDHHGAVTDVTYEGLDIQEFGRRELLSQSLADWFTGLVAAQPPGAGLFASIERHSSYRRLFTNAARYRYFFVNEDVDARARDIQAFQPDISLALHYDSVDPPNNPNGVNPRRYSRVKTYVHGSLDPGEWASAAARKDTLHHVLDAGSYDASFNLSKSVVDSMKAGLGLDYDVTGGGSSYAVAPGVFARNLYLTRRLRGHAHTYIECLHYNDQTEFNALQARDFPLVIQGQTTWYSRRLQQVAFSIRDGVVAFVRAR